jgi:hypothetical protein
MNGVCIKPFVSNGKFSCELHFGCFFHGTKRGVKPEPLTGLTNKDRKLVNCEIPSCFSVLFWALGNSSGLLLAILIIQLARKTDQIEF